MIIADFECTNKQCKKQEPDVFIENHVWYKRCPYCGHDAKRIITLGSVNTANEDAPHIRESARALLNPDTARHSDKPHVRALAENPTRSNLNRYLKAEGIRRAENEGGAPPRYRAPEKPDKEQIRKEVYEKYRERNAIRL